MLKHLRNVIKKAITLKNIIRAQVLILMSKIKEE